MAAAPGTGCLLATVSLIVLAAIGAAAVAAVGNTTPRPSITAVPFARRNKWESAARLRSSSSVAAVAPVAVMVGDGSETAAVVLHVATSAELFAARSTEGSGAQTVEGCSGATSSWLVLPRLTAAGAAKEAVGVAAYPTARSDAADVTSSAHPPPRASGTSVKHSAGKPDVQPLLTPAAPTCKPLPPCCSDCGEPWCTVDLPPCLAALAPPRVATC